MGSIYKRGNVYWIKYKRKGVTKRESTRSLSYDDAFALLEKKDADGLKGWNGRKNNPLTTPTVSKKKGLIYFIGNEEYGVCKIGFTVNLKNRLAQIRCACPFEVKIFKLFKNLTLNDEKLVHGLFDDLRIRGEWYHFGGEFKDFLNCVVQINPQIKTK